MFFHFIIICTQRGLDFKIINNNGHSAIHKAAIKGNMKACLWLINVAGLGLDHCKPDREGDSPVELAKFNGYYDLAKILLDCITKLKMKDL